MDALPLEIWGEISSHVSCGSDWKAWIFTCREFAKHNTDAQVVRFANFNDTILKLYWDKFESEKNTHKMKMIENYIKLRDRGIVLKTVEDLTWDIIVSNPDIPWDLHNMSDLPCITIEHIKSRPDIGWNSCLLSLNPNNTWEIYNDNKVLFNWKCYQMNPCITWDIVLQNPELEWDYTSLSYNPNITWDIVRNNLHLGWDFRALTKNPNITWSIMRENLNFKWDPVVASYKPDLSVEEMFALDLNFRPELSPNITMDIVKANPNYKWYYTLLAYNPGIKFEQLRDNPLMDPYHVFLNPSITVKDVMNNPNYPWDCIRLVRIGVLQNCLQ